MDGGGQDQELEIHEKVGGKVFGKYSFLMCREFPTLAP
jgi:hypothetical protein